MTGYEIAKFVHVVAAIAWVGAALFDLFLLRPMLTGSKETALGYLGVVEGAGTRYFMPASILTLLSGIVAVLIGDIGFGELWITIGFVGIVLGAVMGSGPLAKAAQGVGAAVEAGDQGAATAAIGRLRTLAIVDVAILLVVVWAMVARPGA